MSFNWGTEIGTRKSKNGRTDQWNDGSIDVMNRPCCHGNLKIPPLPLPLLCSTALRPANSSSTLPSTRRPSTTTCLWPRVPCRCAWPTQSCRTSSSASSSSRPARESPTASQGHCRYTPPPLGGSRGTSCCFVVKVL